MRIARLTPALLVAIAFCLTPSLAKKKKDDVTQVLDLPKDPPSVISADLRRLVFRAVPPTTKGLLSAQTHEAVKAMLKLSSGETIVRVRAFVAGSGDLRRIPQIVSEVFTSQKLPLPAVSVVQVGGLPLIGAQVLLESVSTSKKSETAPAGILFVSGQRGPTSREALEQFDTAVAQAGASPVLRVTCLVSSLADSATLASQLASRYPQAAVSLVQSRRVAVDSEVECEGAARLNRAVDNLSFIKAGDRVVAAAVSAPKIILTGTQVAYGYEDRNLRLAFERMNKLLDPLNASWKSVVEVRFYPLSNTIAKQVVHLQADFLDAAHPPAISMLPIEGLPSIDASFAIDAIALPR
jgi:enamine deaminase RidA (YjgF/YER057c/UK114 family)